MRKSMYSLILSDPVVERIDQIAYQKGMSRSQLIDQLLALEVGLNTPEQQLRMIVEQVARKVQEQTALQVKVRPDMGGMQFATYVRYKYNPSIRYSIEFQNREGKLVGILKVASRSTSEDLLAYLSDFFQKLSVIDRARFEEFYHIPVTAELSSDSNKKFARIMISPQMWGSQGMEPVIADYLTQYIMMLDENLRCYFTNLGSENILEQMDEIYCNHMAALRI